MNGHLTDIVTTLDRLRYDYGKSVPKLPVGYTKFGKKTDGQVKRVLYKSRKDTIFIGFIGKWRKRGFPYVVSCFTESGNADKQRGMAHGSVTNRELWYTSAGV